MPIRSLLLLACLSLLALLAAEQPVRFAAGIDHQPWTALLQRHVDAQGRVDYDGWRQSESDRAALDAYLAQYAAAPTEAADGADRHAGLINLYNALTIREVLRLAPEESFWDHKPFGRAIHPVGGESVSLDAIEHQAARPAIGYRVHSALVCAARSCPDLIRQAFTAADLDELLDAGMRRWLADPSKNRYDPEQGTVHLSKIFDWFAADFTAAGGIATVLERHGPAQHQDFFATGEFTVDYLPYDKSLNRQPSD